jgi:hypothetical protein
MEYEIVYTEEEKDVIVTRNHFNIVKRVLFNELKEYFKIEKQLNTLRVIDNKPTNDPSFVCRLNDNLPTTLQCAYDEVNRDGAWPSMHIYSTFSYKGNTFGRHKDTCNVLIVQSKGSMMYRFDNNRICILKPGDSLLIPMGIYHDPIVIEPRITLSFSA